MLTWTFFTDCGLVSHRVPYKSHLKKVVDAVTKRMIESGIRNQLLESSQRFFHAIASKNKFTQVFSTHEERLALNMTKLSGVFVMYAIGISISFFIAMIELLRKRIHIKQRNCPKC